MGKGRGIKRLGRWVLVIVVAIQGITPDASDLSSMRLPEHIDTALSGIIPGLSLASRGEDARAALGCNGFDEGEEDASFPYDQGDGTADETGIVHPVQSVRFVSKTREEPLASADWTFLGQRLALVAVRAEINSPAPGKSRQGLLRLLGRINC